MKIGDDLNNDFLNENVAVDVEENTAFLPGSNPIDATLGKDKGIEIQHSDKKSKN